MSLPTLGLPLQTSNSKSLRSTSGRLQRGKLVAMRRLGILEQQLAFPYRWLPCFIHSLMG